MDLNNKLAVCIPTHNGGERMDYCLSIIIPLLKNYDIPIYISNNQSSDNTESIINRHKENYNHIYTSNTAEMLNYADNFIQVLKMANAQFIWLLGDDDYVTIDGINEILSIIDENENRDCIFISDSTIKFKHEFYCCNDVLKNVPGRILTWMSSYVISRKLINDDFCKKFHSYGKINAFAHTLTLLTSLNSECNVAYIGGNYLVQMPIEKCRYSERLIPIFCDDWYNITVLLKDDYSNEAKQAFLNSNDISWKWFVKLRSDGDVTYEKVQKSKQYIKKFSQVKNKLWIIRIIMCIPPLLLRKMLWLYKWLK